jgi:DNA-binding transcriptional ArsR family regulator
MTENTVEAIDNTSDREVELLKAVAHPVRLALLEALARDEECVCHLSALLERPQPYISKRLGELREAGLVLDRRDGQRIYYRLANPKLAALLEAARVIAGRPAVEIPRVVVGCPCPRCT